MEDFVNSQSPLVEIKPPKKIFEDTAITAESLLKRKITPRELIVGTWLRQGDIGFIYGRRGEGKTFFSLSLACSIAGNAQLNLWKIEKARKVCYVDGEMALENIQSRLRLFLTSNVFNLSDKSIGEFLNFQHYDEISNTIEDTTLNLTSREQQERLLAYCIEHKIEVLFLDNLSCLFKNVKENEADDWEKVQPFLLNCRRNRISVIIVVHAGRSGDNMRGTSKREDIADWIIKVRKVDDIDAPQGKNAKQIASIISFEKNREGTLDETEPQGFIFTTQNGNMKIEFRKESIEEKFFTLVESGTNKCGDIAGELDLSNGYVSKLAQKFEKQGLLERRGRIYVSKRLYKN